MRALALNPEQVDDRVVGAVLCQTIVAAGHAGRVRLDKGHVIQQDDIAVLGAHGGEIHVVQPEEGDLHEDVAGRRLAEAIAGSGIDVGVPHESQSPLRAAHRGVVSVRTDVLEHLNCLPDVSVFTVYDGQPVEVGQSVASAKVTPLVVPGRVIEEAEAIAARSGPVVEVRPFMGGAVGAVVRERLAGARERLETSIRAKLDWFGSPLEGITFVPDDVSAIADAIAAYVAAGVTLVLAVGVNSTDPLDLTLQALHRLDAVTERRGVPAHPGSTCWLASVEDTPVFGLALCGIYSRSTVLDLLLPRFLSGSQVTSRDLARLGHGGVLSKEMGFRFPPYPR